MKIVSAVLLLLLCCTTCARNSVDRSKVAILVDPFTEYLSGRCREYCKVENVRVVDVVSPYTASFLESKGMSLPTSLLAPQEGSEIKWATELEIDAENENVCVIAESDAGVPTAERIASSLSLRGNGISPQLRNKFLSNERVRSFGLKAVKQVLANDWKEAGSFLENELWLDVESASRFCIVKPYRGVASDGVHLCRGFEEARKAFKMLHRKPQFGGGINDAVLVQEYVSGQEYAVDTVAMDGDIKVAALWKYKKLPANGAPFVYQCTELCSEISDEGRLVCEYCIGALKAQGLKWGPTHTEIMATADGPRLIEINARFHAQHFEPIVSECIGYDAMTATLDSYFKPDEFAKLPRIPADAKGYGLIVHLISSQEGVIARINHEEEIRSLSSFKVMHLESEVGGSLVKTVDIRTDCGYVVLVNEDQDQLVRDFDRIVGLQPTLFEVVGESASSQSECEPPPHVDVDADADQNPVVGEQPPSLAEAEVEADVELEAEVEVEVEFVSKEQPVDESSRDESIPRNKKSLLFADKVSAMQGGASSSKTTTTEGTSSTSEDNDDSDEEDEEDEDGDDNDEEDEEDEDEEDEVEEIEREQGGAGGVANTVDGGDGESDSSCDTAKSETEIEEIEEKEHDTVDVATASDAQTQAEEEGAALPTASGDHEMTPLQSTEQQKVDGDNDTQAKSEPAGIYHQHQTVVASDADTGGDHSDELSAAVSAEGVSETPGRSPGSSESGVASVTNAPTSHVHEVEDSNDAVNPPHPQQHLPPRFPPTDDLKTLSDVYGDRKKPVTAADIKAFRDKLLTRLSDTLAVVRERAILIRDRNPQYIVPAIRLAARACLVLAAYFIAAYGSAVIVPIASEFM